MAITFFKALQAIGVPDKLAIRFMNIAANDRVESSALLVKVIQNHVAKWERSNGKVLDLDRPKNNHHEKLIADNFIKLAYEETKEREIGTL